MISQQLDQDYYSDGAESRGTAQDTDTDASCA